MPSLERRLGRVASGFNSRARQHHALGVVTAAVLVQVHVRSGGRCHYCGIELELEHGTWDHAQALSEGGRNDITNLVRCCVKDQRTKHTKTPTEFAAHQALTVTCPIDGTVFQPRWAEWKAGRARYCSHRCAGKAAWQKEPA